MNSSHRVILIFLTGACLIGSPAAHGAYPEKPIRVLVGFPPGGPADTVARLLGHALGEALGKPVVIQNVPGAAGNIAAERVTTATPDGHTLGLMTEAQLLINPGLYKTTYDAARDFAAVSQVAAAPYLLIVNNEVRVRNVRDLIALAHAQPGALTFGSPGSGSTPHLAAEMFKSSARVDIRHIPYKGVGAAVPDLLAGRISMMFSPIATGLPLVREGKVRALAVTSKSRSSTAPEVPPLAESGFRDFDITGWLGFVAPATTPAVIVRRLHLEVTKALALQEIVTKLRVLGLEPIGSSPGALAALVKSGAAKWAIFLSQSSIKPD
jgi:tripartite-type tricarboxylate transporter receptor subunit TctC